MIAGVLFQLIRLIVMKTSILVYGHPTLTTTHNTHTFYEILKNGFLGIACMMIIAAGSHI